MITTRERGLQLLRRHFEDRGWAVRETKRGQLPVLLVNRDGVQRQVRWSTKSSVTWQTSITNEPFTDNLHPDRYWAFVDTSATPHVYVLPERAARTAIHDGHQEYLARHGGRRAQNNNSTHFAMRPRVMEQLVRDCQSHWH